MPALTLAVLPSWLFGIDEERVKPTARADVILCQRECMQVLAAHFANTTRPAPGASVLPVPGSIPASILPAPVPVRCQRSTWPNLLRQLQAQVMPSGVSG